MNAFWNVWRSKFSKQQPPSVIDGCSSDKDIADRFASVFKSVCVPNSAQRHKQLYSEFINRFAQYTGNDTDDGAIHVELVGKCIDRLKKGKAAGIDYLTAEHISLAHQILVVQLTLFFNILMKHSLVPDGFGHGIIIPLLKTRVATGQHLVITEGLLSARS